MSNALNLLVITSTRHPTFVDFSVCRKPTVADCIIPKDLRHTIEHKLAAVRYYSTYEFLSFEFPK